MMTDLLEADEQHNTIILQMENLKHALADQASVQHIRSLIRIVYDSLIHHLRCEEKIILKYRDQYPGADMHISRHREFEERFGQIMRGLDREFNRLDVLDAFLVLKRYLTKHFAIDDEELFAVVRGTKTNCESELKSDIT